MDNKKDEIRKRINRYLNNSASPEDIRELTELFKTGDLPGVLDTRSDEVWVDWEPIQDLKEIHPERDQEFLDLSLSHDDRIIPIRRRRWRLGWVAAAIVVIASTVGLMLYRTDFINRNFISTTETLRTISGPNYVQLPDGSSVTLDTGTKLVYAASFGERDREVTLTGKAYFDVAHDPSKAFRVRTGKIVTTVLGTAFNIDAYPNHDEITVTVTRGKVAVFNEDQLYSHLLPDEQINVSTTDYRFQKKKVNAEEILSWKKNYLVLDRVTLQEAAELIGAYFHVQVTIKNETLRQCVVRGSFMNRENLDEVMTMITRAREATYVVTGNTVLIEGGTGCQEE